MEGVGGLLIVVIHHPAHPAIVHHLQGVVVTQEQSKGRTYKVGQEESEGIQPDESSRCYEGCERGNNADESLREDESSPQGSVKKTKEQKGETKRNRLRNSSQPALRSNNVASRHERYESRSPSPAKGRFRSSISPDAQKKGRGHSPADRSYSPPSKVGQADQDTHRKGRGDSLSDERSPSPELKERRANSSSKWKIESRSRSISPAPKRYSRSPRNISRSRSRSPRPLALPTRRRYSPTRRASLKDSPEAKKTYSSLTPEERSLSPGRSQ